MSALQQSGWLAIVVLLVPGILLAEDSDLLVRVTLRSEVPATTPATVEGRLVVEAQDGGLLVEERSGRLQILAADKVVGQTPTEQPFTAMSVEELGTTLLQQAGSGFEIHETDHYVICSNSADPYVDVCGRMLERVHNEFFQFMKQLKVSVTEPKRKLPVLIFALESDFQLFAKAQHPEISFDDTPGYYSVTGNQVLLKDLTRDRSARTTSAVRKQLADQPLQVATMVHESVHQLAFNCGLQVRLADNPTWLSEGLALYFEPVQPGRSQLWTTPGLVNERHRPVFLRSAEGGMPAVSFPDLVASDASFADSSSVAAAYAESWALTTFLVRKHQDGMTRYLTQISQRKPLRRVPADERLLEFQTAFGNSPDEMRAAAVSYLQRQK